MKSKILYLAAVLLMLYIIYRINYYTEASFLDENLNYNNLVVIDSADIDNVKVYWFCYDLGVQDYTIGRVVAAESKQDIHYNRAFFVSQYITQLKVEDNQLIIETYNNDYDLILDNAPKNVHVKVKQTGSFFNTMHYRLDSSLSRSIKEK